jgi:hypothetical protein
VLAACVSAALTSEPVPEEVGMQTSCAFLPRVGTCAADKRARAL